MELTGLPPDIQRLITTEISLGGYADENEVLRVALEELAERRETIAGIRRGLADVEAGRTISLEEFDRDFRARHGIPDSDEE